MRNVVKESEIDGADPWKGDILKRRASAETLTRLLTTIDHPMVLCVSSPFGSGKSFFAKRWHADLIRQDKTAIYIDAWESEFADDPVVAIVSAIKSALLSPAKSDRLKGLQGAIEGLVSKAPSLLLRASTKIATRLATFGLLDGDVDKIGEVISAALIEEAEQAIAKRIDAFESQSLARIEFRQQLAKLRSELGSPLKKGKGLRYDQNIYVLVDELDRCSPRYAIKFLEATHHLFNVDGFVFVLLVDENQLNSVSEVLYGARTSGEPYIRKFVDWTVSLPLPSLPEYVRFLFDSFKLGDLVPTGKENAWRQDTDYVECAIEIAKENNTSLRTLNQIFGHLNIIVRMRKEPPLAGLVIVLLFIRHQHFSLWSQLKKSKFNVQEIRQTILGSRTPSRDDPEHLLIWALLEALLSPTTNSYSDPELIQSVDDVRTSLLSKARYKFEPRVIVEYISWIENAV